ncbi:MAG: hypothetical protein KBE65_23395 [Phycisphaerae bacterium]|nr:hypothetical protein [Phycisphaerae bacterium]
MWPRTNRTVSLLVLASFLFAVGSGALARPTLPSTSGSTATFTGDQSYGIFSGVDAATPPYTTFTIHDLTTDITPATGTPGVSLFCTSAKGTNGSGGFLWEWETGDNGGAGQAGYDLSVIYRGGDDGISTSGLFAYGIGVRSYAGEGGDAGDVWGIAHAEAGNGGRGGTGGAAIVCSDAAWPSGAGSVILYSPSTIETTGWLSPGIYALSQGGDGGAGGDAEAGGYGEGGNGGKGGSGGPVMVLNNSRIVTTGLWSAGISANSLGANGGSAGYGDGIVGAGGSAVGGGSGGTVSVTDFGYIHTTGIFSCGIFAQSVGGFAGSSGSGGGILGWGGSGDSAGDGGQVVVEVSSYGGFIHTEGFGAPAVFAQSVGGGGGSAGTSGGLLSLGGSGSSGGNGGEVCISNGGFLRTQGNFSCGILAQSIGGGGGDGGDSGGLVTIGGSANSSGDGDAVIVNNNEGVIITTGSNSHSILAQSIGGGGGSAGDSYSLVAIGGAGAAGGDGGTVTVNNGSRASLSTSGNYSRGIMAQSIGGGGGSSGSSYGLVTIGGSGSGVSNGGAVTIASNCSISTWGNDADAIFAQSIGGGGGDCSYAYGGLVFGGSGLGGGNGGTVTIQNGGILVTRGANAAAISAQSIGGGGGSGGGMGALFTYGATGGGGASGNGGTVNISNTGAIWTKGSYSNGIFAQSIGGAGGCGNVSDAIVFSLGGGGNSGGSGGTVTVANSGNVETSGCDSSAVLAQSVGGGGGAGGSANSYNVVEAFGLGGASEAGGNGGQVHVSSQNGSILTKGDLSHGIHAQSIGGGGGTGGSVSNFTVGFEVSVDCGLGGCGGAGGTGAAVDITSDSGITTLGQHAHGLFAQSIGGGGGSGGSVTNWNVTIGGFVQDLPSLHVGMTMGGAAGDGGDSGVVSVNSTGNISTSGFRSYGILAQSVGGGGGDGGNSMTGAIAFSSYDACEAIGGVGGQGGNGNTVSVDSSGRTATTGDFAYGILAQSIGGGGGSGGNSTTLQISPSVFNPADIVSPLPSSISLSIGGAAGGGGNGGLVSISNAGEVATAGGFAHGILAQSIGGGGGSGGDATAIEADLLADPIDLLDCVGSIKTQSNLTLGGSGGTGGSGAAVLVQNEGNIATQGHFANGILAQSIGGGGGTSGSIIIDEYSLIGLAESSVRLQGVSSGDGDGADVTVDNTADITTEGVFSHGILAQSIGGGGGYAGISEELGIGSLALGFRSQGVFMDDTGLGIGFAGSTGGDGSAGTVSVTHTGSITTLGDMSHGILAQSVAGHDGTASPVTVTLASDITTYGVDSDGIHAQSLGGYGYASGNISISIGGTVQGGSGAGVGVNIDGGANNTLTNAGSISSLSGTAILGSVGHDIVINNGIVTGSVLLAAGANAFDNHAGARFDSGARIELGTGNALTNAGVLSPGGLGAIVDTTLIGDLVLSSSSVLEIEIGGLTPGSFDSLSVTGDVMAGLAGSMMAGPLGEVGLLDLAPAMGSVNFSFLSGFDVASELGLGESAAFEFLTVGSEVDWTAMAFTFSGGPSDLQYSVFWQDGGLLLQVIHGTTAIPAPGALLLTGLGLGLLGWRRMRTSP